MSEVKVENRGKIVGLMRILEKVWESISYETDIINEVRWLLMELGITIEADKAQRIIEKFDSALNDLWDIIEEIKRKV
ncbi:MAG: hypothetical protein MRT15_11745 [archaeon YNP-LCB-003-016]|uniref:hypothetical protein n=1 Tax=Candidatus Culexarchaeum yellowstonense TaxID=2928963 RepID=UPI0026F18524|nr:hypothetical protein [Candidatus Culexarchaeum yellowstonense]MCR6693058.1 hypothetical protein [Candidatus Culexarchaeum yellowstonense]